MARNPFASRSYIRKWKSGLQYMYLAIQLLAKKEFVICVERKTGHVYRGYYVVNINSEKSIYPWKYGKLTFKQAGPRGYIVHAVKHKWSVDKNFYGKAGLMYLRFADVDSINWLKRGTATEGCQSFNKILLSDGK